MSQVRALLGAPSATATAARHPAIPRRRIGARGFEPPTSCAQGRRATRLRYAPREATAGCTQFSPGAQGCGSALAGIAAASERLEVGAQRLEGAPAVADAVLLKRRQLRERASRRLDGQE